MARGARVQGFISYTAPYVRYASIQKELLPRAARGVRVHARPAALAGVCTPEGSALGLLRRCALPHIFSAAPTSPPQPPPPSANTPFSRHACQRAGSNGLGGPLTDDQLEVRGAAGPAARSAVSARAEKR